LTNSAYCSIGKRTYSPLTYTLFERIIKAYSNEGDVVLDCFCDGSTTISVARKLNRKCQYRLLKLLRQDLSKKKIYLTMRRLLLKCISII